jgi:hypothetical protein
MPLMHDDVTGEEPLAWRKPSRLSWLLRWQVVVPSILFVLVILSPAGFRQWWLSRVPDIGDPFPVSEILKPIPEEENAFPLFEEAFALLKEVADADREEYWDEETDGWDSKDNQLNKYLKMNRPALEKWREATEKENFQAVPIAQAGEFYITNIQAHLDLPRWCQLEIERLTKTGKPADALPWLRASFRYDGLMTRNAPVLNRLVGAALFARSADSAEKWMQHPDVTRDQLLDLISIVQASARLMEKPSTTVKVAYLVARQEYAKWSYDDMKEQYKNFGFIDGPPLGSKWETWLLAEPEFSRRLGAHLTANLLVFVDNPRRKRQLLLDDDIFDESAVGVTPAGHLPAHKLIELLKDSKLIDADTASLLDFIDREQARRACLQVALAAQAYYRDRGEFSDRLADLQPDYLSSLPDDPYAPQPMPVIYRRTDDQAVVYSRFTNEIDDGGTTVTYDEARGKDLLDFGFRIRTPREQPVVAPNP